MEKLKIWVPWIYVLVCVLLLLEIRTVHAVSRSRTQHVLPDNEPTQSPEDEQKQVRPQADFTVPRSPAPVVDAVTNSSTIGTNSQTPQGNATAVDCDVCDANTLSKPQLDYIHIELTRQKILDRLGLTAPPNITQPLPSLPHYLLLDSDDGSEASAHQESHTQFREIIVLANDAFVCDDDNKTICYSLTITSTLNPGDVNLIKFHVYRKGSRHRGTPQTDTLELFESRNNVDSFLVKAETDSDRHWLPFKIPLSRFVASIATTNISISNSDNNSSIAVNLKLKCSQCVDIWPFLESPSHIAYLVIKVAEPPVRARRQVAENDELCHMVELYVSLENLGYENWIIHPSGYQANYCTGRCQGQYQLAMHGHAHNLMMLPQNEKEEANVKYRPCCTPAKLSPISIVYRNQAGDIIRQKDVPDMVVDSCRCA